MADQEKSPVTSKSFSVIQKGNQWAALGLYGQVEQWFQGPDAEKDATRYAEQRKAFFKATHPEWFSPQSAGPGSEAQQQTSQAPTISSPPIPALPVIGQPVIPSQAETPVIQPPVVSPPPPPPQPPPPPPSPSSDGFRNTWWPSEEQKTDGYRLFPKGDPIRVVHWPKDPGPPVDPYEISEEGTPVGRERKRQSLAPGVEGIGTYDVAPEGNSVRPPPPPPPQKPPFSPDWRRRIGGALSSFKQISPQAAAFGGVQGIGRAASASIGAAFPEFAIPAAIGFGMAEKLKDLPGELKDFAEKVAASNKELANFSPALGVASMQLRFGDMQRQMDLAQRTGESGAAQMEAVNRMRFALHPLNVLGQDIQNRAGSFAAGAVSGVAEATHLEEIVDTLKEWMDSNKTNEEQLGKSITTGLVKALFPGIGAAELIGSTIHAVRDYFLDEKTRAAEAAAAKKKAAEKEARLHATGPWDAMLFAQSGPGRAFPRLDARRVNLAKEAHDAQFIKEHQPPRH